MLLPGKLFAWIEPGDHDTYLAVFISADAIPASRPAVRECASQEDAKQLIEELARDIKFEVEWVEPRPETWRWNRNLDPSMRPEDLDRLAAEQVRARG